MSDYLLYGTVIVENDSTMKSFAKSICKGTPTDGFSKEYFKEEFMDLVNTILKDDVSRTDINYEELMYKYRFEIGDLLYEIENHSGNMQTISFFGEGTKVSFNRLVEEYIDIHFNELMEIIAKEEKVVEVNKTRICEDCLSEQDDDYIVMCGDCGKIICLSCSNLTQGDCQCSDCLEKEEKAKKNNK